MLQKVLFAVSHIFEISERSFLVEEFVCFLSPPCSVTVRRSIKKHTTISTSPDGILTSVLAGTNSEQSRTLETFSKLKQNYENFSGSFLQMLNRIRVIGSGVRLGNLYQFKDGYGDVYRRIYSN